jgi:hypothetical protein
MIYIVKSAVKNNNTNPNPIILNDIFMYPKTYDIIWYHSVRLSAQHKHVTH